MTYNTLHRIGLQGVIAATTRLSRVDGQLGELIIAGYRLDDIAPYATYEEMLYLLWHDRLPTKTELSTFQSELAELRQLPSLAYDVLRKASERQLSIMDALRIGADISQLNALSDDPHHLAKHLVAVLPTIVASYWRFLNGADRVMPDASLSHAENYLYMLSGSVPSSQHTRALDTYLNTVIDHGLNASTFAGRVIIATQSDMVSAIVGAIGALKGPLHGGAPGPALDMVFEIGTPGKAEAYLRAKLDAGERLMGFGHRVYKVRDPRADVLNIAAEQFFADGTQRDLYELALHVEATAVRLLEEYKPDRKLQTNVEFYTALLLHGIGLDNDLFTPTFAISRVGGWTAHALEHLETGRLLRPLVEYQGETDRIFVPLNER
ncbi:MAG: citrate synthase/methylcitrate synthase [Chloroflexota bacterium]